MGGVGEGIGEGEWEWEERESEMGRLIEAPLFSGPATRLGCTVAGDDTL